MQTGYAKTVLFFPSLPLSALFKCFAVTRLSFHSIYFVTKILTLTHQLSLNAFTFVIWKNAENNSEPTIFIVNLMTFVLGSQSYSLIFFRTDGFFSVWETKKKTDVNIHVKNPSQRMMTSNICKFLRYFYPGKRPEKRHRLFFESFSLCLDASQNKQFIIYSNDYGFFSLIKKKPNQLHVSWVSFLPNQTSRKNGCAKIFAA